MSGTATLSQSGGTSPISTGRTVWMGVVFLGALVSWFFIALPYLTLTAETMNIYADERTWIVLHVGLGTVALLTGPVQLWLGFAHRRMSIHRSMGKVYMVAVFVNALVAFRLATTPVAGWVFGLGLAALAVAWLLTTGMAYLAIRRRQIPQHREWMIRSYVATFAFVFFRMFVGGFQAAGVGTVPEQLTAAAWLCWSLPLVVTEVIIQSRKALGSMRTATA